MYILQQFDSVYSTVHNFQKERLENLEKTFGCNAKKARNFTVLFKAARKNMNKSGEILKIHVYTYSEGHLKYIVDLRRSGQDMKNIFR